MSTFAPSRAYRQSRKAVRRMNFMRKAELNSTLLVRSQTQAIRLADTLATRGVGVVVRKSKKRYLLKIVKPVRKTLRRAFYAAGIFVVKPFSIVVK